MGPPAVRVSVGVRVRVREREGEREADRDRETHTERQRERKRRRETETGRQGETSGAPGSHRAARWSLERSQGVASLPFVYDCYECYQFNSANRSLLPPVAGQAPVAGGRAPGPLMISDERLLCPARGNETLQSHNMRLQ